MESYFRKVIREFIEEKINVIDSKVVLDVPYDGIKKTTVAGRDLYVLFGDIDYFPNKEAILALKRKSDNFKLDYSSYGKFLQEFKKRFNKIAALRDSELLVSVETTCPITAEVANILDIPFIKNGFRKINPSFKMRDINDFKERMSIEDLFDLDFSIDDNKNICIIDDFVTSGSTFKNAFNKLPPGINAVGVCLFQLKS